MFQKAQDIQEQHNLCPSNSRVSSSSNPLHKTEVQDGSRAKIVQMLQMCSLSSWSILNIFDYLLYQILTFKLIHELSHIT